MDWNRYEQLTCEVGDGGVLEVTVEGVDRVNSLDEVGLRELARVWLDADDDPEVRVVLVTGRGDYFSAGGNLPMERRNAGQFEEIAATARAARDLVYNLVNCEKVTVSAINGPAVGAGLVAALLADISVIGEDVTITDGHVRIGLAAGDHACLVWPLLCGLARAKWYLLTGEELSGRRAAEIGLVSRSVAAGSVLEEARAVADRLAGSPQYATRWTKRALNHWLRDAGPIFETSLALEVATMFGRDYAEGLDAFLEKRAPDWTDGR